MRLAGTRFSLYPRGFGTAIGLALVDAALIASRSYQNRPVFGRWSYPFAAMIAVVGVLAIVAAWRAWHRRNGPAPGAPAALLDSGVFLGGVAYGLNALLDPATSGRAAVLNLFGSVPPVPALIEWAALVAFAYAAGLVVGRRLKGRWIDVGGVVAMMVIAALLAEGVVRVRVAVAPATQGFPTYSSAAWARRYVRLNSLGFRDRDHAADPAPGARRLLVVGDSFAFGWGIHRVEDRLGEQLAGILAERTGRPWESINASVGDRTTLEQFAFLDRGLTLRPDVVLLIYVFNDINYLVPDLYQDPLIDHGGTLDPLHILYVNSYLFQEVYVRLRRLGTGFREAAKFDPYADDTRLSRHLADVARLAAAAGSGGAVVRLVPFDPSVVLDTDHRNRYQRFVQQAARFGIPLCSLEDAFNGRPYSVLKVNALDAHPSATANYLAAVAAADCLALNRQ